VPCFQIRVIGSGVQDPTGKAQCGEVHVGAWIPYKGFGVLFTKNHMLFTKKHFTCIEVLKD